MAGLSSDGFSIKRQEEVISNRETDAKNYLGSDIDTDVNSVLGRILRIGSADEADVWEVALMVFNSFNPDFATGVALDRLVSFSNLEREGDSASSSELLVTGDYETFIPKGSGVSSRETNNNFSTSSDLYLDESDVSGFSLEVIVAQDNAEYSVSFDADEYVYTSTVSQSEGDIAQGVAALINSDTSYTAVVVNGNQVKVIFSDIFLTRNVQLSSNMYFKKVSKIVNSYSDEYGSIYQPRNTLTVISSPVNGWDSVYNIDDAVVGRYRETDEELRARFKNSKEARSVGTVDAIYSALLGVSGVSSVQVYENTSQETNSNGVPPKEIHAIVLGGNTRDIANTLWATKPGGINYYGSSTVSVEDSQGLPHNVSFSRPTEVPIKISIVVSEMENKKVASNVQELIANNLVTYFEENYLVGDDVIYSRLYQPLNLIPNLQIDSLTVGRDDQTLVAGNVSIDYDEVARLRRADITITGP